MKKKVILLSLFIGPLAFFLFLASGHVNHKSLAVFDSSVAPIDSLNPKDTITFKEHVNVLTFLGKKPATLDTETFNLNEVVFKKIAKYKAFQLISVYDISAQEDIEELQKRLQEIRTDKLYKWQFIPLDSLQTTALFNSLNTTTRLDNNLGSSYAFIIDKFGFQRGRDDDEDSKDGIVKEYFMQSVNTLKNKMYDDLEVTFYEQFNKGRKSREERLKAGTVD